MDDVSPVTEYEGETVLQPDWWVPVLRSGILQPFSAIKQLSIHETTRRHNSEFCMYLERRRNPIPYITYIASNLFTSHEITVKINWKETRQWEHTDLTRIVYLRNSIIPVVLKCQGKRPCCRTMEKNTSWTNNRSGYRLAMLSWSCHYGMTSPDVADGVDGIQIWGIVWMYCISSCG